MVRFCRTACAASTLLMFATVVAPADAALGRGRDAGVSFHATGPAGLKIEGKTNAFTVSEQGGKVHFVVPLAGLDTGIALRNKHMREKYLEVGKYPNAELVVERSALEMPADGTEASGSVAGMMTIHGRSRPVQVTYKAQRSGASLSISGGVHLNIKEFGIDVPSYLGVTVKPDIDVYVRARVDDL